MSPGKTQQQARDKLRERFVASPSRGQLHAMLSARELQCNETERRLLLAQHTIARLEKDLDRVHAELDVARRTLAELDAAQYWAYREAL